MKKRQILLAVILMLSLAFAFTPAAFAKKKAKAPKLNKTKVTLQVGKNATLKVKNTKKKVTWKSSNKSVATVSKKGVVKAKKEGKATITAKVAGKSLKCKVTVKANTPVTPASKTLEYVGRMPLEDKIEKQEVGEYSETELETMGYKDVPGEYHYVLDGDGADYDYDDTDKRSWLDSAIVRVDVPVTIKTASAVCKTTGTKIGNYNGTTRYELDITGSAVMPDKGYIWKYYDKTGEYEKVEIPLPKDSDAKIYQAQLKNKIEKRIQIYAYFFNKGTDYKVTMDEDDSNTYVLRNLGDTDEKFNGYVSACTMDAAGNFTFKVYDVSIIDALSYFSLSVNGFEVPDSPWRY